MGKLRLTMRQVPWQSWEHWKWVATELFSDSPDRISAALDRISAWQSRGKVPVAVEITAAVVSIHLKDARFNKEISEESTLSEDLLRMMYAMAIQRLVNGVVDQSHKRNVSSVADRAESAGLPRLLVDIRHEAAHTELPGLALLQIASKQALAWLKLQYWDRQRATLVAARKRLKAKLVQHCLQVVDILFPRADIADLEHAKNVFITELDGTRNVQPRTPMAVRKKQRIALFYELRDLSLSSISDLLSILVDDGMLEQDTLLFQAEPDGKESLLETAPVENSDLVYATAWKFTLKELSSHISQLPGLLLMAIVRKIDRLCLQRDTLQRSSSQLESTSAPTSYSSLGETPTLGSESLTINRLMLWCTWLLGKGPAQDSDGEQELLTSKLSKISNALSIKANLDKELLCELLKECLCSSNGRGPLVELVSLISVQLGSKKFQTQAVALAQLGTSLQRVQRSGTDQYEADLMTSMEGRKRKFPFSTSVTTGFTREENLAHELELSQDCSEASKDLWMAASESRLVTATNRQKEFLDRLSTNKPSSIDDGQGNGKFRVTSKERILKDAVTASTNDMVSDGRPGCRVESRQSMKAGRWTVAQNWRPCAIGMVPSAIHGVGVMPSLDYGGNSVFTGQFIARQQLLDPLSQVDLMTTHKAEYGSLACTDVRRIRSNEDPDDSLHGKRPKRTGKQVHFADTPLNEGNKTTHPSTVIPEVGCMVENKVKNDAKVQSEHVSLMQGCLLLNGTLMQVSSQQLETMKAGIHVL